MQHQQRQNLLSAQDPENRSNPAIDNSQTLPSNLATDQALVKNQDQKVSQIINPIQQLLKNNNILPLLAVIDHFDVNQLIEEKPLLCIMATKFVPLQSVLKNKNITFPSDNDRRTPLHYAIQANDVKAASWCIQNGNPNQRDNFGNTPILEAIRLGRRRCFLLCLKNKFYDERAPIIAAMFNKHWELKVLSGLRYDIDIVRDEDNRNAFERALQYCSFDCAQFLIQRNNNIDLSKYERFTQSQGLIRKLKKIQKQQSLWTRLSGILYPLLILTIIFLGLNGNSFLSKQNFPYETTAPLYTMIVIVIISLYGLTFVFGNCCGDMKYTDQHALGMILSQPSYKNMEEICPVCVHFTHLRFDHCFICGCCVEKFHFHTFTCVHKANEVFWILGEICWLYLTYGILEEFHQSLQNNFISLVKFYTWSPMKLIAQISVLMEQKEYLHIFWLFFITFLFLYQLFYCLSIFGMMCMRRKYQQVIHSQKYLHLYDVVRIGDSFVNKQKKVFKRGFLGGIMRCARNVLVYFFIDN